MHVRAVSSVTDPRAVPSQYCGAQASTVTDEILAICLFVLSSRSTSCPIACERMETFKTTWRCWLDGMVLVDIPTGIADNRRFRTWDPAPARQSKRRPTQASQQPDTERRIPRRCARGSTARRGNPAGNVSSSIFWWALMRWKLGMEKKRKEVTGGGALGSTGGMKTLQKR